MVRVRVHPGAARAMDAAFLGTGTLRGLGSRPVRIFHCTHIRDPLRSPPPPSRALRALDAAAQDSGVARALRFAEHPQVVAITPLGMDHRPSKEARYSPIPRHSWLPGFDHSPLLATTLGSPPVMLRLRLWPRDHYVGRQRNLDAAQPPALTDDWLTSVMAALAAESPLAVPPQPDPAHPGDGPRTVKLTLLTGEYAVVAVRQGGRIDVQGPAATGTYYPSLPVWAVVGMPLRPDGPAAGDRQVPSQATLTA